MHLNDNYAVVEGFDGLSETINMNKLSVEQDDEKRSGMKTHEEILAIIQEIKAFEEKFKDYSLLEVEQMQSEATEEELLDVEPLPVELEWVEVDEELLKPDLKTKLKILFKLKSREELEPLEWTEANLVEGEIIYPTVFKVRFNKEGKLEYLDIKKAKSKPDIKEDLKKLNLLKKIKRKGKKEESEAAEGGGGKLSKLKGGFGKIGKIKKVIPSRGKKKKEPKKEEPEKEETEEAEAKE